MRQTAVLIDECGRDKARKKAFQSHLRRSHPQRLFASVGWIHHAMSTQFGKVTRLSNSPYKKCQNYTRTNKDNLAGREGAY